jgi:hypothetical protein
MPVIYRHEVPVDDKAHRFELTGRIIHVGCRKHDVVEFWAITNEIKPYTFEARVVGTGHEFEEGLIDYGTTYDPSMVLVWHLVGRTIGSKS